MHALLPDPAEPRQGKHLEPAGVREDRSVPGHESVQASQIADHLVAGPHVEMIGIGKLHLRADPLQILRGHGSLDGGNRPHIHENRGLYDPVYSMEPPSSGGSVLSDQFIHICLYPLSVLVMAYDRRAGIDVVKYSWRHGNRQVHAAVRAVPIVDGPAEASSPVRIVQPDPAVKRHPVGDR